MGSTSTDQGASISVDVFGNVYTTGSFQGNVDFDPGVGVYYLTSAGDKDIFIQKLDASGNFLWAVSIGGSSSDYARSIAIDNGGNVFLTGFFQGTVDFDPSTNIYNLTDAGYGDIFILKLSSSGNFQWARGIGSQFESDYSNSITLDNSASVYVTGCFEGTVDFDPGTGIWNLNTNGLKDVFIQKSDSSGNFLWAKNIGGSSDDLGQSIKIDHSGNIYTSGIFTGVVDFDPDTGIYNLTSAGDYDMFLQKLDAFGNFLWTKRMGSTSYESPLCIAIDASGNIYTTGYFTGTVDFDPAISITFLSSAGMEDMFIQKLDASGNFQWVKNIGSPSSDQGNSVAVDAEGNIYTTGYFYGTVDFDPGVLTYNLTSIGSYDIFIQKIDPLGNFIWAASMGSNAYEQGNSITVDTSGNVYVTGLFAGTVDFDPSSVTSNLTSAGGHDIFIAKYSQSLTSIVENYTEDLVTYPNPNKGEFYIAAPDNFYIDEIRIFNAFGEIVYQTKDIKNKSLVHATLSNGLYYVQLQTNKGMLNRKIVVSH